MRNTNSYVSGLSLPQVPCLQHSGAPNQPTTRRYLYLGVKEYADKRGMKLIRLIPVFLTLLIVLWTIAVTSFTKYGDNWALYPILVIDLIILIWHVG